MKHGFVIHPKILKLDRTGSNVLKKKIKTSTIFAQNGSKFKQVNSATNMITLFVEKGYERNNDPKPLLDHFLDPTDGK